MEDRNDISLAQDTGAEEQEAPRPQPGLEPARRAADEFQLTIRKLDVPVRPRGVLAE